FSIVNYNEAERVVAELKAITEQAETLSKKLPENQRDAFFELVLHPVKAPALVTEMYVAAAKNQLYAAQGRASANELAAQVKELFQADQELSDYYNHTVAGGKWPHMMDQKHIGYTTWQEPPRNVMPAVREIELPEAGAMGVAVEGSTGAWPAAEG